jgi:hypothetical protein
MIDILYNKLKMSNDISLIEWNDIDTHIFNKHSQHSQQNKKESKIMNNTQDISVICEKEEVSSIKFHTQTPTVNTIHQDTVVLSKNKKKSTKDMTIKPFEIIISETLSFNNSTDYIKDTLITMISKDEFSKIFGLTKCAEIMSGIVNNRWNKSTALFISFLFDKEVYYNDKLILYNKEKNRGRITIP